MHHRNRISGIITGALVVLAFSVPSHAAAPTAKHVFTAKVRIAAVAYGKKHGWHIDGKIISAVSTTTFLGTTTGYGSSVVSFTGTGIAAAAATWGGKITRKNGHWVVSGLKLGAVSRVSA